VVAKGSSTQPAPELELGCCSYGAHFADDDDLTNLRAHAELLTPAAVAVPPQGPRKEGVHSAPGEAGEDGAPVTVTRLVDDACIFLNRVGFDGGTGCSLHIAALEAGERPMDWKPSVCWQVPIRLEHSTDESGHVTSRLREWKRRDWGEGGADFGWWCTEEPDAFVGADPLYVSARDDLVELVGEAIYDLMVVQLERPELGSAPPSRRASLNRQGARSERTQSSVSSSSNVTPYFSASAAYSSSSSSGDSDGAERSPKPKSKAPDRTASVFSPLRTGDDDPSSRQGSYTLES
jgi:hypothetical protein